MPIYEYRCTKCGNLFEEWTKSFDSPEEEACPECGGKAERVVSRTTFKLVGSGWFATDYGKSGSPSADTAEKKGDTAGSAPAPKAETASGGAAKAAE